MHFPNLKNFSVAAIAVLSMVTMPVAIPADAADAPAARLASHRAAYSMSFGSARAGGGTVDARGVMLIEFSEACDGWTTTQRVHLDLVNSDGDAVQTDSNFSSWEARDNSSYRFTVRNVNDGKTSEEFQGAAKRSSAGGQISYEGPDGKRYPLGAKTLFPTAHMLELIRHAEAGDKVFFNSFFDGATPDGPQDVNVVIGAKVKPQDKPISPLLGRPSWPIHIAYFDTASPKPDPDYEVALKLYDNGIADEFVLDYGDFTVMAKLERIESLTRPGC
jgi:EipB-like